MTTDPAGARAEAIRGLRTHVMAQHLNAGRRALAVCSPTLDSGCTFVTVNLAVAFAQLGLNVLLIDADLREPGVQAMLPRREPGRGLVACLSTAELDLSANVEPGVQPNLSVLHSGGPVSNALELLGDAAFDRLIAASMREYDLTLIDTPPANVGADALRVGEVAGYGLIVGRKDRSFVKDIKTLDAEMAADGVTVVGAVLVES